MHTQHLETRETGNGNADSPDDGEKGGERTCELSKSKRGMRRGSANLASRSEGFRQDTQARPGEAWGAKRVKLEEFLEFP